MTDKCSGCDHITNWVIVTMMLVAPRRYVVTYRCFRCKTIHIKET